MALGKVLSTCLLLSTVVLHASAQYRPAFSTVTVYGGVQENVNETLLHQYWSTDRDLEVVVSTPLHFGEGEVGVMRHKWRPDSPDVPAFDSILGFAAWSAVFEPIRFVQLQGGVRIGAQRMTFDVDSFPGAQNETEVVLGIQSRLRISPVPWAGVYVGASHMQTYTYIRMKLTYVSVGIHATMRTSELVKTVLR